MVSMGESFRQADAHEVESKLWVGNMYSLDSSFLRETGIEAVLSLIDMPVVESLARHEVLALIDGQGNSAADLGRAVKTACDLWQTGERSTLVHCQAGFSRSVCVTAACIGLSRDRDFVDALATVASRRLVMPNDALAQHVLAVFRDLRGLSPIPTGGDQEGAERLLQFMRSEGAPLVQAAIEFSQDERPVSDDTLMLAYDRQYAPPATGSVWRRIKGIFMP